LTAARQLVDAPREQLLAGAALARDEDGGVGLRRHRQAPQQVGERRRIAHDQGLARGLHARAELLELAREAHAIEQRAQAVREHLARHGLGDVVVGAALQEAHGVVDGGLRRHDQHRRLRALLLHLLEHLLAADVGHQDVRDDGVDVALRKARERRPAAVGEDGGERLAPAVELEEEARLRVVVGDEHEHDREDSVAPRARRGLAHRGRLLREHPS
jgi:hypothetical protein